MLIEILDRSSVRREVHNAHCGGFRILRGDAWKMEVPTYQAPGEFVNLAGL